MRRVLIYAAALSSIAACAQTSGVLPLGPDTYRVSVSDEVGGAVGAQTTALKQAGEYCSTRGLYIRAVAEQASMVPDFVGDMIHKYDLTFRCLQAGDPDLTRPTPRPAANVTVDVRQEKK